MLEASTHRQTAAAHRSLAFRIANRAAGGPSRIPVANKADPKKRYFCKEGTHPVAVFLKLGTDWPLAKGATIAYRHADASPNAVWLHGVVTLVHPDGYFNIDRT